MGMSSFFRALRASYQAEIDDLTFDSDGRNVLRKRLLEKRSQLRFLSLMIESSPEMVAVVLHGGFRFELPSVMEQLLTLESDEFPDWDSLADAVKLTPWASDLAKLFLQEPQGGWFMTVAAALEYLYWRAPIAHQDNGHTPEAVSAHADPARRSGGRHLDHGHDFDADDESHQQPEQEHDEASADWLENQGFDRKA
jgi:hypothetical protein